MKEIKPSFTSYILSAIAIIIVTVVFLDYELEKHVNKKLKEYEENLKSWK